MVGVPEFKEDVKPDKDEDDVHLKKTDLLSILISLSFAGVCGMMFSLFFVVFFLAEFLVLGIALINSSQSVLYVSVSSILFTTSSCVSATALSGLFLKLCFIFVCAISLNFFPTSGG